MHAAFLRVKPYRFRNLLATSGDFAENVYLEILLITFMQCILSEDAGL